MKLILLMMLLRRKPANNTKACVVAQTTTTQQKWDAVLEQIYRKVEQLEVYKQYARTATRQMEAESIARLADAMIVINWRKQLQYKSFFLFARLPAIEPCDTDSKGY